MSPGKNRLSGTQFFMVFSKESLTKMHYCFVLSDFISIFA